MRKREFVGVTIIGAMICFICFIFGRKKGFLKGYIDADNMMFNEGFKPVSYTHLTLPTT